MGEDTALPECTAGVPMCSGPEDRTGVTTDPLGGVVSIPALDAVGGSADHVALAFGRTRGDTVDVGVAWREGCGSGSESVRFRRVRLRFVNASVSVSDAGTPVTLASGVAHAGSPTVAYAPDGFLVSGATRGEVTVGAEDTGGWFIAFEQRRSAGDPTALVARRVSEADGALLDDAEQIAIDPTIDAKAPHLYADVDGHVRSIHVSATPRALRGARVSCTTVDGSLAP